MALSEVLIPESSIVQLLRLFVMRTIDLYIHYDCLTTVIAENKPSIADYDCRYNFTALMGEYIMIEKKITM